MSQEMTLGIQPACLFIMENTLAHQKYNNVLPSYFDQYCRSL